MPPGAEIQDKLTMRRLRAEARRIKAVKERERRREAERKVLAALERRTGSTPTRRPEPRPAVPGGPRLEAVSGPITPTPPRELEQIRRRALAARLLPLIEPAAREAAVRAPSAEVSGALALGPNLYRKLGGRSESELLPKEGSAGLALVEAATLLPWGRPVRGARAGLEKAAREAVGRPPRPKPVERVMPEGAEAPTRALRLGEKVQQLPAARSRVARALVERPADAVSRAMMGEGRAAKSARRVLPTATAEARVAKATGREQLVEASRSQATVARHLKTLPKEGSPADVAHFWWAQLPKAQRSVEGLKTVRAKLADELQRYLPEAMRTVTRARSGEETRRRLAALDKTYEELLSRLGARLNPYPDRVAQATEQLRRNALKGRRAAGRAVEGRVGGPASRPLVSKEIRDLAETKLHELIERDPAHPVAARAAGLIREREQLRRAVNEAGEASIEGRKLPDDFFGMIDEQVIAAGEVAQTLNRRLAETRAAQRAAQRAGDRQRVFEAMREIQSLKVLLSDLPGRVQDLALTLAQLDQVIAKTPKVDEGVVDAVRTLSQDRRQILESANVLKPERAAMREGLVSRWLGLEPTGEEAFIGHRLGKVRGSHPSGLPVAVATGKVRLPEGVARENKLVRAKTGRVRASTRVAAEDWQAAQVYRQATSVRSDLARMGKPFTGQLPEGHMLVNPKGRAIPPHWKTDRLAKLAEQGWDEDEIATAAREIVDSFIAGPEQLDELVRAAREAGVRWDELRVVPEKVVKRYYGQFIPAQGATKAGKAYDAAVDFTAASIIFARLGYIPKNILQNLAMAVPHQGVFLLANVPRAAQVLADSQLRPLLSAEVGFSGATAGLAAEARFGRRLRGVPAKAAGAVGAVADTPMRISAFLHEAAAAGVISKLKPVLDDADKQQLIRLLTDKRYRPLLNDIRSRSVESMADFSRLTPQQRRWARRFLVIPGWLAAGSRYPVHFAATHPGRAAALAYVGAGEPGAPEQLKVNKPFNEYLADDLPHFIEGIDLPGGKTMRTTSVSPVSTPWEIANALAGRSPETALGYANPLAKAVSNIAGRRVETSAGTAYRTGYGEAAKRNLERIVPNVPFVRGLISPKASDTYPEDATRAGRLKREIGVVPIEVGREYDPDERAYRKVFEDRNAMHAEAQRLAREGKLDPRADLDNGRLPAPVREAFNRRAERMAAYANAERKTSERLSQKERLQVDLKLLQGWGLADAADVREALLWARTADDDDIRSLRRRWSASGESGFFHQAYLETLQDARRALEELGANLD